MSCERAVEENSRVVVEIPTSWSDRCRACCNECGYVLLVLVCSLFIIICIVVILTSLVWVPILLVDVVGHCQKSPTLSLEDVNMRNMVVYQNSTDSLYQVRSEFSVNLTARNPNTVAKCFSTFRRMSVSVEYKGQQIVRQEVPLGFGLKPKEGRTLMLDLRGDGYPLKKESALLLDVVLRNSSGVGFLFTFKSRVMRNDRKARWFTKRCDTVDRTPLNGNFSQAKFNGGLAWSSCVKV